MGKHKIKFIGMNYQDLCKDYPEEYIVPFGTISFDKSFFSYTTEDIKLSEEHTNIILMGLSKEEKKPLKNLLLEFFANIRKSNIVYLYNLESGIYPDYILSDIYMFLINHSYLKNIDLNIYSKSIVGLNVIRYLKFKKHIDSDVDICIYKYLYKMNDDGVYLNLDGNVTELPKNFSAPQIDLLMEMA